MLAVKTPLEVCLVQRSDATLQTRRISGLIYQDTKRANFIQNVMHKAVTHAENAGRHGYGAVTGDDVQAVLRAALAMRDGV